MVNSRVLRVYPNRRLYDPVTAQYIKYDDVFAFLRDGVDIHAQYVDGGLDCTHKILVDIVVRQELELPADQCPMLTTGFLRELIRQAETANPALVAEFLNHTLRSALESEGEIRARR